MRRVTCLLVLGACATGGVDPSDTDPTSDGYAVGVLTTSVDEHQVEVWYPTTDPEGTDTVSLADFTPQAFRDRVGADFPLPGFTQPARRDAAPAPPPAEAGWPVVLFSHGFGGFRTQSATLCAHLASRGYVVVSTDHPGRMITDVVPCLLDPPAGTCTLSFPPDFDGVDPALEDLADVLAWLAADAPAADLPALDLGRLGIFGHSAGGGSTSAFASAEPRVRAALPLAGSGAFTRELPSAVIGGSCDGIVKEPGLAETGATSSQGYWSLAGAGHLAFSDLCAVDLGDLADRIEVLDDANALFLFGLRALAVDGCPGASPLVQDATCTDGFLPLESSDEALRYAIPAFFDQTLLGEGEGIEAGVVAELVRP